MQKTHDSVTEYLIALGANLPSERGSLRDTIAVALRLLGRESLELVTTSRLYRTPAFPPGSGPDFVNAAVQVRAALSPGDMLAHLHRIEADLGRARDQRWAARVIDLDLLAAGETVLPDPATVLTWMNLSLAEQAAKAPEQLILPHPRLHDRAFVLLPLADIAPDWQHPLTGRTVAAMRDALGADALAGITVLDEGLGSAGYSAD